MRAESVSRARAAGKVDAPDTLPIAGRSVPPAGPITAFIRLVDALAERDHRRVTDARLELRRRGFDVRPLGTPPKAVRR